MANQQMRTPKSSLVKTLAESRDRFKIFTAIFTKTPLGTPRICDIKGVGPANVKMCKISLKQWKKRIANTETNGQCKGVRFFSFGKHHSYYRCDAAASNDLCDVCKRCEQSAISSKNGFVSPEGCSEYDIVQKTTLARIDVKRCLRFWECEGINLRSAQKLYL